MIIENSNGPEPPGCAGGAGLTVEATSAKTVQLHSHHDYQFNGPPAHGAEKAMEHAPILHALTSLDERGGTAAGHRQCNRDARNRAGSRLPLAHSDAGRLARYGGQHNAALTGEARPAVLRGPFPPLELSRGSRHFPDPGETLGAA